ncbi:hypothetical protein AcW1_001481 [Taiwanofungus camphoratus]|nr:hypothetical protein AcW1_001481 [Antrodia cinnamomea]
MMRLPPDVCLSWAAAGCIPTIARIGMGILDDTPGGRAATPGTWYRVTSRAEKGAPALRELRGWEDPDERQLRDTTDTNVYFPSSTRDDGRAGLTTGGRAGPVTYIDTGNSLYVARLRMRRV